MKFLDLSMLKIMLIDDNRHMRSLLTQILRSIGVREIVQAEDGASGFQLLHKTRYDIVIVDHQMAPITGTEFTRLVRVSEDSPNPFVPILMITGYADKHTIINATNAGVNDIVVKPVSAKVVSTRLADLILNPKNFVRTKDYFGPDRREGGGIVPTGGIGILAMESLADTGERRRAVDRLDSLATDQIEAEMLAADRPDDDDSMIRTAGG
ncbi:MAG: hypothetical protein TEF_17535 [Rhizobiales bacterium NRL2]|nr:MAG: hypothetical protein TEF_17535 [Rhizobiales bacterium NRL2]